MKTVFNLMIGIFLSMGIISCEEGSENINENPIMITAATGASMGGNYNVKLLTTDSLYEGYNKITVELTDKNNMVVEGAQLKFHPLMDMITKVHAAPVEHPVESEKSGFYDGAIVFIMPSSGMMGWSVKVSINDNGVKDTVDLQLPEVRNLDEVRKINVVSEIDGMFYFISLIEPSKPEVGINDLEFAVHCRENMMSFPPAEDLTIEFEPEMPSMDHGSPNNVNPDHTENGHYKGKINFTMTGWWRVHLTIKKGNDIVKEGAYFDVTFQ